jgi:hypothetical protein
MTLLILFIVSFGATAYLFRDGESLATARTASLRAFEEAARTTARALLDTRAAQQAYVAAGQGGEFWPGKVADGVSALRGGLAALRNGAESPQTIDELEAALGTLDDFAQLDRRARDYTRTGQNLLASDLIFGDGVEMIGAIDARLEQARKAEASTAEAAIATFRNRQVFALVAGFAAAALTVLLLLPGAESSPVESSAAMSARPAYAAVPRLAPPEPSDLSLEPEGWSPPKRLTDAPAPEPADPRATAVQDAPPVLEAGPPAIEVSPPLPARTDLRGLASLCTDLARVVDTDELPRLLDRASAVLDARGIILWIADPDGRELIPIIGHGYPAQLVNRLGTIERDAENATAAAFRTSLLQIVHADAESTGAIAAPLVTPGGCVGVMAAEVRGNGEREESRLAAASIVAAQLATLVGPPSRSQGHTEAAGALSKAEG